MRLYQCTRRNRQVLPGSTLLATHPYTQSALPNAWQHFACDTPVRIVREPASQASMRGHPTQSSKMPTMKQSWPPSRHLLLPTGAAGASKGDLHVVCVLSQMDGTTVREHSCM